MRTRFSVPEFTDIDPSDIPDFIRERAMPPLLRGADSIELFLETPNLFVVTDKDKGTQTRTWSCMVFVRSARGAVCRLVSRCAHHPSDTPASVGAEYAETIIAFITKAAEGDES